MGFPVVAYVLSVSTDRGEHLFRIASEYWERPVSHPVPSFGVSGRTPIVVFASFDEDVITHIADGKRGPPAGTGMVQLQIPIVLEHKPLKLGLHQLSGHAQCGVARGEQIRSVLCEHRKPSGKFGGVRALSYSAQIDRALLGPVRIGRRAV